MLNKNTINELFLILYLIVFEKRYCNDSQYMYILIVIAIIFLKYCICFIITSERSERHSNSYKTIKKNLKKIEIHFY